MTENHWKFNIGIKKKFFLILFCLTLFATSSKVMAQTNVPVSSLQKDTSEKWHLLKQVDGIKILYQYVDCGPVEYIHFKAENTTSRPQAISWKFHFFNEGSELETNPDDVNIKLTLNGNNSVSGTCNSGVEKLRVFVKEEANPLRMSEIKLTDLTVSIAQ